MRLLHTSDWHLGQTLHQYERGYEHQRFLDWLLGTLERETIDALLIAGDVFDNANPSAAAQTQLYRFLTEARRRVAHLDIIMTAGNHDSPGRLEAPAPLLAQFGVRVVGQVARSERNADGIDVGRLVVPLTDRHGAVAAWCIAMPFLRPGDVPRVDDAGDAYLAGIKALYAQAYAEAAARRQPGQAVVALGHCHLSGGQTSDESERRIVVGGAEALPASIFDAGIAYVALGHLHLAQSVGGDATRRYCGSPLPLSFSEIGYAHQVVVVELEGEKVRSTRSVAVPRSVELMRVPPQPAPFDAVLDELEKLDAPEGSEVSGASGASDVDAWPYLQVRALLTQPEPGLRARVEAAIAGKALRLARIETVYAGRAGDGGAAEGDVSLDQLASLAPVDFFERLYRHRFDAAAPHELLSAFNELLHADGGGEKDGEDAA